MPEQLRLNGPLAKSSKQQDALAESAAALFEKLRAEEQAKLAKPATSVAGEPTVPKLEEYHLQPSMDGIGAKLNIRLSREEPSLDVRMVPGRNRNRPKPDYHRSPKSNRKRYHLPKQ